jgi:multiple sugar transport system permease protein
MHTVLILGAVTMVYPFLLMLGTSLTSSTDTNEFRVVPRYLYDEKILFAKYVDDKYWGDLDTINRIYHTRFLRLQDVVPPQNLLTPTVKRQVADWLAFKRTLPLSFLQTGFRGYGLHPSLLNLAYIAAMRKAFHDDIHALGKAYDEDHEAFDTVLPLRERPESRNWNTDLSRKTQDFLAWKKTLPEDWLLVTGAETLFAKFLQEDVVAYGGEIRKAVAVWGPHRAFDEIALPIQQPTAPAQRRDWNTFVRTKLPFRFL